jgi:hypothetical protein
MLIFWAGPFVDLDQKFERFHAQEFNNSGKLVAAPEFEKEAYLKGVLCRSGVDKAEVVICVC